MSLHDSVITQVDDALKLIKDLGFGVSATYQVYTTGSYDPVTGTAAKTMTEHTVNGVLVAYNSREIDGEVIRPNDSKFFVTKPSLNNVVPTLEDTIVVNGQTWHVVNIMTAPGGGFFTLQVRRI
jgi:hypothetical protein